MLFVIIDSKGKETPISVSNLKEAKKIAKDYDADYPEYAPHKVDNIKLTDRYSFLYLK